MMTQTEIATAYITAMKQGNAEEAARYLSQIKPSANFEKELDEALERLYGLKPEPQS